MRSLPITSVPSRKSGGYPPSGLRVPEARYSYSICFPLPEVAGRPPVRLGVAGLTPPSRPEVSGLTPPARLGVAGLKPSPV